MKRLYEEAYIQAIATKIKSLVPSLYKRKFTTAQMPDAVQIVYDEGKAKGETVGYKNGYSKGYRQGYSSGKTEGHDTAYDEGYGEGISVGIESGEKVGYSKGYTDGAEHAITSIPRAEGIGF